MAQPWLPDACLTSRRAAQPISAVVDAWGDTWFKHSPWQVLGSWDEASLQNGGDFNVLKRAGGFEITGKDEVETTLALAMLGAEGQPVVTSDDADALRKLGKQAIRDLEGRIGECIPQSAETAADRFSTASLRVFSLLIGPIGEAQIALECPMGQLAEMTRKTYSPIATPIEIVDRSSTLEDVRIKIAARLGSASISLKELSGLEEGDVLLLDSSPDDLADLIIEGRRTSLAFAISETDNSYTLEFQEKR